MDMNKAIKITLTIYFASSLFLLLFVFELLVPTMEAKLIGLFITMVTVFAVYLLYRALRNPFRYPYFEQAFDVSNKRNVNIEDWIDRFLANERNEELTNTKERLMIPMLFVLSLNGLEPNTVSRIMSRFLIR